MTHTSNPIVPLTLLSDEPIEELEQDGLGLESWAKVIAGIAIGTDGPFTVGVFGRWGSGKTSILRLAKKMVEQSERYALNDLTTVAFNAWEYEQESFPLLPLIASIVAELNNRSGPVKKAKVEARKLHDAFRSLLFGLSTKFSAKIPLVGEASVTLDSKNAIERYEDLNTHWIEREIEKSLYYQASLALREIQGEGKKKRRHRLVVFIDDLDRCFPDKAIQLLQSIKLVLNHPGFIFVLAIDRNILESYLDKRYTEEFGLKFYHQGQSYLDKIIQLPLWIPPHEKRFDLMIEKLLSRAEMAKHRIAFEPLAEVLGWACEHNPRQLVRLFNDILVGQTIYRSLGLQGEFPLSPFVIGHGVRHQSDAVYQGLLRNHSLCKKLRIVKDLTALRALIHKMLEGNKAEDSLAFVLQSLQSRDSLIQLLLSDPGREWLKSSEVRGRVDSFLAAGWRDTMTELDENTWIQNQVHSALLNLESTNEDVIVAACDTIFALGDHNCLPALKLLRTKWKDESRVGRSVLRTYQRLRFSYGISR
jgi:hypothetical protein